MIEPLDYEYKYSDQIKEIKDKINNIKKSEPERFKGWLFETDEEINKLRERISELEELEEKNKKEYCDSKLDLPIVLAQPIFKSIEGESLRQNKRTVFVRFQGCNLRCSSEKYPNCHCDSEYTFKDSDTTVHTTIREIIEQIKDFNCKRISITGGEPLLHKKELYWLLWHLSYSLWNDRMRKERYSDYDITIETNGSIDFSWVKENFSNFVHIIGDWKCPNAFGIKANQAMLESNLKLYNKNDALKFIVTKEDFEEVDRILNIDLSEDWMDKEGPLSIADTTNVFVGPAWGCINMRDLTDFIINNKYDIFLNFQMHKFFDADLSQIMNIPSVKKGVDNINN